MTPRAIVTQADVGDADEFVSVKEMARKLNVGEETLRTAIRMFEKDPTFPKPDALFAGKRYWPAVRAFLRARYGLTMRPRAVDGQERWDAQTPDNSRRRRA